MIATRMVTEVSDGHVCAIFIFAHSSSDGRSHKNRCQVTHIYLVPFLSADGVAHIAALASVNAEAAALGGVFFLPSPGISLGFTILLLLPSPLGFTILLLLPSRVYLWGSPFFFFCLPSYISGVHHSSSSAFPAISLGFSA